LSFEERRSTRACRLSNLKTQPSVPIEEKSQPNEEPVEIEEEIEDPDDPYKIGDIFWVRIGNNPWWPALLYGRNRFLLGHIRCKNQLF